MISPLRLCSTLLVLFVLMLQMGPKCVYLQPRNLFKIQYLRPVQVLGYIHTETQQKIIIFKFFKKDSQFLSPVKEDSTKNPSPVHSSYVVSLYHHRTNKSVTLLSSCFLLSDTLPLLPLTPPPAYIHFLTAALCFLIFLADWLLAGSLKKLLSI